MTEKMFVYTSLAASILLAAEGPASQPIFDSPYAYYAGDFDLGTAVSDLNGDNHPDLVVSCWQGPSVLINKGDGTFEAPAFYAAVESCLRVFIGDFDEINGPDLAVTNRDPGQVSIFLNNGDGTFGAPTQYDLSTMMSDVVGCYLNNDTHLDLVVGNFNGTLGVMLGKGDGTFEAALETDLGMRNDWLEVGDLNGDLKTDVVFSDYSDGQLGILFGDGAGGFETPTTIALDTLPSRVFVRNLDGDTDLDIVYTSAEGKNNGVCLNDGTGGFSQKRVFPAKDGNIWNPRCEDLDGDGDLDILAPQQFKDGLAYYLNDGAGNLRFSRLFASVPYGQYDLADFNGDGVPDVSCACYDNAYVFFGDGHGSIELPPAYTIPETAEVGCSGDFDGDSDSDIALIDAEMAHVSLFQNAGDGNFAPCVKSPVSPGSYRLRSARINADNLPDLVMLTEKEDRHISVMFSEGGGSFASPVEIPATNYPSDLLLVDMDGDNDTDLVTCSVMSSAVSVFRNDGAGGFAPSEDFSTEAFLSIQTADIDGDTSPDLVGATASDEKLVVLRNNGSGGLLPGQAMTVPNRGASGVVAADFNGDHRADLMTWSGAGDYCSLYFLYNNGDGTFTDIGEWPLMDVHNVTMSASAFDVNGDQAQDVVIYTTNGYYALVLLNNGDGTFDEGTKYYSGRSPQSILSNGFSLLIVDDFDGDADLDVACPSSYTNTLTLLFNNTVVTPRGVGESLTIH